MWCWGCDVRRAAGNLLLAYGAEKRPSSNPRYHSAYTFRTVTNEVINLWGWGLWIACADKGSLLISRSHFRLRYTQDAVLKPDAWQQRDLPHTGSIQNEHDAAAAHSLLSAALIWIGDYESWVYQHVETDYRERVLKKWPQRRQHRGGIPASEMAAHWFDLSTHILEQQLT
ncbi:MAG: hypothetical protein KC546_02030 [Anaerolineae bacterium]|nr:hypothetical protein [Anaerolineae bacterium]